MRRKFWYFYMRAYIQLGLHFFYKNIRVVGAKNVPKNRAVIFLPNHVNTFMDAVVVATTHPKMSHHMARADVFNSPRLIWLMSTINLRPIYRLRDGKDAVTKNEQVFQQLQDFMNDGECVMMHPEGTHTMDYRLRSLKKGFTRLAFGFLEQFPDKEVDIIPVGINYDNPTDYGSNISIHYGKPIDARPYFEMQDQNKASQALTQDVNQALLPLVTNIDDVENYDKILERLKATGADLSNPAECNPIIQEIENGENPKPIRKIKGPGIINKIIFPFALINNWAAVLMWKKMKPTFKDPAWHGPMKLALGISLVPITYALQTLLVAFFFGWVWALIYLFLSMITVRSLRIGQSATRLSFHP
ncbi:1-acyl-sn-glycerol-3-phosphate acyltransferase [Owenweeksia hongkongensis]|uniref:1-acyl-sn-glycerol-3-phosphate acyltransferase n=1 Tax=Owenweeksia hongkongensis TaxID=253245 RepID=UPI003A904FCD